MTCLQITLPVPGAGPAVLTLPQPLTPQVLLALEQAVAGGLGMLRRDLVGLGASTTCGHAVSPPDAAEIEYASWMPDPGDIEMASWRAHMRALVR